jgi:imidazoleglycerol phosphate synthase glutamine amidotransferase subunit HisH
MCTNLGWQECAMKRKWIGMLENKKTYLILYFLHKYMIAPTAMQLNSLKLVYDIC